MNQDRPCASWQVSGVRWLNYAMVIAFFLSIGQATAAAYEKQLNALAVDLANKIEKKSRKNVAVVDFVDLHGNTSELGRFVAEELSTRIVVQNKHFSVVDRANLKYILEEAKLTISGLVRPRNAKMLGRIAGIDAVVIGTITPIGDQVRIFAKVIGTDSARILAAGAVNIAKTQAVSDLLSREVTIGSRNVGKEKKARLRTKPTTANDTYIASYKHPGFELGIVSLGIAKGDQAVLASFEIKNNSRDNLQYGVATSSIHLTSDYPVHAKIISEDGLECSSSHLKVSGIGLYYDRAFNRVSPLYKGSSNNFLMRFMCKDAPSPGSYRLFLRLFIFSSQSKKREIVYVSFPRLVLN